MTILSVFHGTEIEVNALMHAFKNNCICTELHSICVAHKALATDQSFVDQILFYRHIRAKLEAEEGLAPRESA